MRLIAQSNLVSFWARRPETRASLERWAALIRQGEWATTSDIQASFPKAKVLNRERVRFEVAGGDYRLIAAFKFKNQIAFVKFVGTHADYDRVDALTIAQF